MDAMRPRKARLHPDEALDLGERASGFIDQASGVGHLAAGLEVERRARQRDIAGGPRGQGIDRPPVLVEQRHDRHPRDASARVSFELVASALQRRLVFDAEGRRPFLAPKRALASRAAALLGHGGLVAGLIHPHAMRGCGVFDEFVGDPEGVVQAEGGFAREHTVGRLERLCDRPFQPRQAFGQHRLEPVLLGENRVPDHLAIRSELRIRIAHLANQHVHPGAGTAPVMPSACRGASPAA
jgi:hypothetical protein